MVDRVTFAPFAPLSSSAVVQKYALRKPTPFDVTKDPDSQKFSPAVHFGVQLPPPPPPLPRAIKTKDRYRSLAAVPNHFPSGSRAREVTVSSLMRATCPDLSPPRAASASFTGSRSYSCLCAAHRLAREALDGGQARTFPLAAISQRQVPH